MEIVTEITGEARSFPMCVYKREGVRYYMTNLEYLNRDAVSIVTKIIKHIAEHSDTEAVRYRIPSGTPGNGYHRSEHNEQKYHASLDFTFRFLNEQSIKPWLSFCNQKCRVND